MTDRSGERYFGVPRKEVLALLRYAVDEGKGGDEKTAALAAALSEPASEQSSEKILAAYGDLVKVTQPVNGRSVFDSERASRGRMLWIAFIAVVLFVLATGNLMADSWAAEVIESGKEPSWLRLKQHVWDKLTPFLWGGLGSCVFLLKTLQDRARRCQYEKHKLKGWAPRIVLGGILAAIALMFVHPASFGGDVVPLTPAALAFFVGLSVKAFYKALERVVEKITAAIGGGKEAVVVE